MAILGCIADDASGAAALVHGLEQAGVRCVQFAGAEVDAGTAVGAQAMVFSLQTRHEAAHRAVAQSVAALQACKRLGCERFYFSIAPTFDSTERGNVGVVLDALMRELPCDVVTLCPADLQAQVTVYRGHAFVGDVLLGESAMARHALTPMTDSNLVRVLQRQVGRRVGLLQAGAAAPQPPQAEMVMADATSHEELQHLAAHCAQHAFAAGSPAFGLALAKAWGLGI
jgi:uncharacterized protein YgbK (DUF1537 family)